MPKKKPPRRPAKKKNPRAHAHKGHKACRCRRTAAGACTCKKKARKRPARRR